MRRAAPLPTVQRMFTRFLPPVQPRKSPWTLASLVLPLALGLVACVPAEAGPPLAAAGPARTEAADSPAARGEAVEAARQLMDLAEQTFPTWFPAGVATQTAAPFAYRQYPQTGITLAVVVQAGTEFPLHGVYVVGGDFGAVPVRVGAVADFMTPVAPVGVAVIRPRR